MSAIDLRIVYLQFTSQHQQTGLNKLKQLMTEFFPNSPRHFCVVDNSINGNFEISLDLETDFIPGDNCSRDFSGYDLGIGWLQKAYPPTSKTIWIFANDTFHRDLDVETLKFFKKNIIDFGIRSRAIIGYQDCYPKPVHSFGLLLHRWIRTNFFILTNDALIQALPLSVPFEDESIFGVPPQKFFKDVSPLSERYRDYLQTWLFGKKDPLGEFKAKWRSSEKLTKENFQEFKAKTRAILSEHYLSARLLHKGIPIVPVNHGGLARFIDDRQLLAKHQNLQTPKPNSGVANPLKSLNS